MSAVDTRSVLYDLTERAAVLNSLRSFDPSRAAVLNSLLSDGEAVEC